MLKALKSIFSRKRMFVTVNRKSVDCSIHNQTHKALQKLSANDCQYVPTPRERKI